MKIKGIRNSHSVLLQIDLHLHEWMFEKEAIAGLVPYNLYIPTRFILLCITYACFELKIIQQEEYNHKH